MQTRVEGEEECAEAEMPDPTAEVECWRACSPKQLPPPSEADLAAANVERDRLLEGPLLDLKNDCRADIAAGYGRDG